MNSVVGQTAPRQPAVPQEEIVVHKEELPDPDDENEHGEQQTIMTGL